MTKRAASYEKLRTTETETANPMHDFPQAFLHESNSGGHGRALSRDFDDHINLRLTDLANIAIPLSYFLVGFAPVFVTNPTTMYEKLMSTAVPHIVLEFSYTVETLAATPSQQNTIGVLKSLPWCAHQTFRGRRIIFYWHYVGVSKLCMDLHQISSQLWVSISDAIFRRS